MKNNFKLGAVLAVIGIVALVSGLSSGTVRRTLLYTSSMAAVIVGGAWLLT